MSLRRAGDPAPLKQGIAQLVLNKPIEDARSLLHTRGYEMVINDSPQPVFGAYVCVHADLSTNTVTAIGVVCEHK